MLYAGTIIGWTHESFRRIHGILDNEKPPLADQGGFLVLI
jgi:hypothetical protein